MEFEDLKPSKEAQEIGEKYLLREISAEDAIQQIKEMRKDKINSNKERSKTID